MTDRKIEVGKNLGRALAAGVLLLLPGIGVAAQAFAAQGKLVCDIEEKLGAQRVGYTVERLSKENHTVYYFDWARLVPHYYLRLHGMTGGGAQFLHLDIEDTRTSHTGFTRVIDSGKLRFGTKQEWIEVTCRTEAS